jgi:thymidine kinase
MSLELYIGSMFSGKSSAVIAALRRKSVIGIYTMCITHSADTRYAENAIASHSGESYPATAVPELMPLLKSDVFRSSNYVIIEEANFFPDLKQFVIIAVETLKKHVLCVGLDGDYERKPFGQLLDLIPYADEIKKFKALCSICKDGTEACFTDRISDATDQLVVGGAEKYQALCRSHFLKKQGERNLASEEKMKEYLRENVFPVSSNSIEYLSLILEHVPLSKCDIYLQDVYPLAKVSIK